MSIHVYSVSLADAKRQGHQSSNLIRATVVCIRFSENYTDGSEHCGRYRIDAPSTESYNACNTQTRLPSRSEEVTKVQSLIRTRTDAALALVFKRALDLSPNEAAGDAPTLDELTFA